MNNLKLVGMFFAFAVVTMAKVFAWCAIVLAPVALLCILEK